MPRPPLLYLPSISPFAAPLRALPCRRVMAYTCSASTNAALVDNLLTARLIRTPRVEAAMRGVDRSLFVPSMHARPYTDCPHMLPCNATISAPHMHAMALEHLAPALQPGSAALDIGAGSGYLVACMALMVGDAGRVIGIEHVSQLADLARHNLDKWMETADPAAIDIRTADGRDGAPDKAPFAAIHVGAAAPIIPQALIDQLAPGGVMVIPVGAQDEPQSLEVIRKDAAGHTTKETVCGVRYVPLCDLQHQVDTQ